MTTNTTTPLPAPRDAERRSDQQTIQALALLMGRLARALHQVAPEHPLPACAIDHLRRKQLPGSPLREIDEAAFARMTERGALAWRDVPDAGAWVEALRGGPESRSEPELEALAQPGDDDSEPVGSQGVPR